MHGGGKDRASSTNLAPNKPLFVQLHTVLAAATAGRLSIDTTLAQFGEAFLVYILNPPTQTGVPSAGAQLILNSPLAPDATFANWLPAAEYLAPGCHRYYPLPGWLTNINIDARGVSPQAWATPRDVSLHVVVYAMDRTVREQFLGQQ